MTSLPEVQQAAGRATTRTWLVFLASWLAAGCSVPPVGVSVLAVFGLAPFWVTLRNHPGRVPLLPVLSALAAYGALRLIWVLELTGWIGIAGFVLLTGIWTALALPLAYVLARWIGPARLPLALVAPLTVCTHDVLRLWLIEGSSWHELGYALATWTPVLQLAEFGDVLPLSLLAHAANGALADLYLSLAGRKRRRSGLAAATLVAASFGAAWWWGEARIHRIDAALVDGPLVAGIQPNIAQGEKMSEAAPTMAEIRRIEFGLMSDAASRHPDVDLMVWPETSLVPSIDDSTRSDRPVRISTEDALNGIFARTKTSTAMEIARAMGPAAERCRYVIGVITRADAPGTTGVLERNTALYLRCSGRRLEILDRYHKRRLVPFGEYLPGRDLIPFRKALESRIDEAVAFVPDMAPGNEPARWRVRRGDRGYVFDLSICYEIVFVRPFLAASRDGCDFHVNISNDAWYGTSSELDLVHRHALVRAVASRRSIVRVSNNGISTVVDPCGRVSTVVERDGRRKGVRGWFAARIPVGAPPSPLAKRGDVLSPAVVVAWLLAMVFGWLWKRRGSRSLGASRFA